MRYDSTLLLGFGGPEEPAAIRPFIDRVLAGRKIPEARYELVVSHYERMGGSSPYNQLTRRQAHALEERLRAQGNQTPIAIAYRCADPDIDEVLAQCAERGVKRILGIILAPHRGASWGRYQESVERARERIGPSAPHVEYTEPYFDHPLFIRAHVERALEAFASLDGASLEETEFIFTAHSIPIATPDASEYVNQITQTATMIAAALGTEHWQIAYQSRSGSPHEPWLEPDIKDVIRECAERQTKNIVVVPIGFLCDHIEVLYDLDVDAQSVAQEVGVNMARAQALNDHPLFIRTLAELVQ